MAIRERPGVQGTRYATVFQDVGVQHSRTFDTREEAEDYQQWATEQIVVECRCQPRPRRLSMSRATLDQGKIICGTCGQPFTEAAS